MCTVTFWPNAHGYRLGMNRDEQHARPKARPPGFRRAGSRTAVWPTDPAGGTWIGINDAGATFALVNAYSVPTRAIGSPITRGIVVARLLAAANPAEALSESARLPVASLRPFRVAGIFPRERVVLEWRWNGLSLDPVEHPWAPRQWVSSGLDEPTASRVRGAVFARRSRDPDAGSAGWIRRLHASHAPERGAFSTCVHRADAGTVSYTAIEWREGAGTLAYTAGCPCGMDPIKAIADGSTHRFSRPGPAARNSRPGS